MHHFSFRFSTIFPALAVSAAAFFPILSYAEVDKIDLGALGLSETVYNWAEGGRGNLTRSLLEQAFSVSPDGIVTETMAEMASRFLRAQAVAQAGVQYWTFDLDSDGAITVAEIDLSLPFLDRRLRAGAEELRVIGDKNNDGQIDAAEVIAMTLKQLGNDRLPIPTPFLADLLAMDLNADGRTTPDEIVKVVKALDDELNADGVPGLRSRRPNYGDPQRQGGLSCSPPKPEGNAEVVLVSGYEGAALSNIAVAGQDSETTAVRLVIEPGKRPLYIIVSAYGSMVWQVEGVTERVQRIVVQPRATAAGPGAAVTGIDRAKVSFVPAGACFKAFYESGNGVEAASSARVLAKRLGRDVDRVIAQYTLPFIALPSGKDVTPPPAPSKDGAGNTIVDMAGPVRSLRRFHPLGLSEVDIAAVVAEDDVSIYEVLPQEAGLAQLYRDGAIVAGKTVRRGTGDTYLIRKPIARFPAGLNGAHSVTFILGKGVPMPAGDPGHSLVIDEVTGKCLSIRNQRCNDVE